MGSGGAREALYNKSTVARGGFSKGAQDTLPIFAYTSLAGARASELGRAAPNPPSHASSASFPATIRPCGRIDASRGRGVNAWDPNAPDADLFCPMVCVVFASNGGLLFAVATTRQSLNFDLN